MKKKLILLLAVVAFGCHTFAQVSFNADSIPVKDGKVFFKVDFQTDLNQKTIRERVKKFLNSSLEPYSGEFVVDNENSTVCLVTDYLAINTAVFSVFAMYMTYNLLFDYKDGLCTMTLGNVRYMEKEYFETKEKQQPYMNRKMYMPEYTAEDIMIDKKYKVVMINKASEKVTDATLERINSIIKEIDYSLLRK